MFWMFSEKLFIIIKFLFRLKIFFIGFFRHFVCFLLCFKKIRVKLDSFWFAELLSEWFCILQFWADFFWTFPIEFWFFWKKFFVLFFGRFHFRFLLFSNFLKRYFTIVFLKKFFGVLKMLFAKRKILRNNRFFGSCVYARKKH